MRATPVANRRVLKIRSVRAGAASPCPSLSSYQIDYEPSTRCRDVRRPMPMSESACGQSDTQARSLRAATARVADQDRWFSPRARRAQAKRRTSPGCRPISKAEAAEPQRLDDDESSPRAQTTPQGPPKRRSNAYALLGPLRTRYALLD